MSRPTSLALIAACAAGLLGLFPALAAAASAPVVTEHPAATTVLLASRTASGTATFKAQATGEPEPSVRWQSRATAAAAWADVEGATGLELVATVADAADGRQYRAVFTNEAGEAATDPATVVIHYAPSILTSGANRTVEAGLGTGFNASFRGKPAPTTQFQTCPKTKDCTLEASWTDVPGATETPLLVTGTPELNGSQYRAIGTNPYGTVITVPKTLTVRFAPLVNVQPADVAAVEGEAVTFSPAIAAEPAPTFQWQVCTAVDCSADSAWADLAGETGATLGVDADADADGNSYRVKATNQYGTATTEAAALIVS